MTKYCFILIAVLFCALTYAQSPTIFHRGYPLYPAAGITPDTSVINISGLQLKDGNYVSLDGMIPQGDSTIHFFLITKYMKKGDIAWTKRIATGTNLGASGFGSIYQSFLDSIYFSVTLFDGSKKQLIGALEPKDGAGLWMKAYDNNASNEIVSNIAANLIVEGTEDSLIHQLLNFTDDNGNQLIFNKMKRNGDLLVSKSYKFEDTANEAYDYNVVDYAAVNDGFISTGNANALSGGLPIVTFSKFDKSDNIILNKAYASSEAEFFPIYSGVKIASIGKDYVIAGQYFDINFLDFPSSYLGSFVLKVDSIGNIVWSKIIDKAIAPFNSINGLTIDRNENIILTGKMSKDLTEFLPFMLSVDKGGKQNWLNIYEKSKSDISALGELFNTMDNGFGYFYHDIDNPTDTITKGVFIKTDDKGKVGCETKLEDILLVDNAFVSDTLLSKVDTIEAKNIEFIPTTGTVEFDIPILSLNIRPFCPNEVIDWTFDASVKDAVKWEWSDNSKADTLRVFSTGEYSVTVTIDGKYCFMLCDTATVERTDLPKVQALKGPNVCVGAPFTITSSFNAASSVSSKWTKEDGTVVGTNVGSITTSTLGKYTVTIIDQCGDSAKSTITIDESIYFPAPSGFIIRGIPVCKNTEFTLTADGVGGGGGPYTFLWSENGATTSVIKVNKLGTYKVTVTDKCGLTAVQSINVDESVWLPAPTAAISFGVGKVCKDAPFLLSGAAVGGGGEPYQYLWNTGETTEVITGVKLGSYSLTVTDKCGLTNTKSVTVDESVWFSPPTAAISFGAEKVCKDAPFLVSGAAVGGGGNPYQYLWNTGETTEVIMGVKLESYSLTVTDKCGLKNTKSVTVDESVWFSPPLASIDLGPKVCEGKEFTLLGSATGDKVPFTYKWSTDETTQSIIVDKLDTYSLTVTDNCKRTNIVEKEIKEKDVYLSAAKVEIKVTIIDSTYCAEGALLSVIPSNDETIYKWSTGETSPTISVAGNQSYSVTVTDSECKTEAKASVDVKLDSIKTNLNCVKYPKIFMPDAQLIEQNKFFGGFQNECGVDSSNVTGYVINVFNRWGQQVFTSNDINVRWNGRNDNDDNYASDVYVWYSRFNVGKFCKTETKGDVTLFR